MSFFKIMILLLVGIFSKFSVASSLVEIKVSDASNRYLKYTISQNEPNGRYKIWNLTQNKQIGYDISKNANDLEVSDILLLEANPGDVLLILNPKGLSIAKFSNGEVEQNHQNSFESQSNQLRSIIVNGKKSLPNTVEITNKVGKDFYVDHLSYLKSLRYSHQKVSKDIKKRKDFTVIKLNNLLKTNSENDITKKCEQVNFSGSDHLTMAMSVNCQDLKTYTEALKVADKNLEKINKYESEIGATLKNQIDPNQNVEQASIEKLDLDITPKIVKNNNSCSNVAAKDYVQYRLFSAYFSQGKGIEDIISVPIEGESIPNSVLWSKKGAYTTFEEMQKYNQSKDIFLDRCRPFNPSDFSSFSSAMSSYKKVNGIRRADFKCINGQVWPAKESIDPFKNYFTYEGERLKSCLADVENGVIGDDKTCSLPSSWKVEKFLKGEVYTQELYNVYGHSLANAPVQPTGDSSKDIAEMEIFSRLSCKNENRIYSIFRTPLVECGKGYIGQGKDVYYDITEKSKNNLGGPFGAGENFDKVLLNFKNCKDFNVDISKSIDGDKIIKLDGIFIASNSNEEFKVDEHLGLGKISISSLYRDGHYKSLANQNENGRFVGTGVDYPGTCVEVVPFEQEIERVSNEEIKITQKILEDSCIFKKGDIVNFLLKKK